MNSSITKERFHTHLCHPTCGSPTAIHLTLTKRTRTVSTRIRKAYPHPGKGARMAIRWDEFPHKEIRLKIYPRLGQNAVGRSEEDSVRHILRRRLSLLDPAGCHYLTLKIIADSSNWKRGT